MFGYPKIGLEAILDMGNFNKGADAYMRTMGVMEGRTGGIAGVLVGAFGMVGKAVLGLGAVAGGALVGFTALSVKTAISVESAWAGVTKTTDGLIDDMGDFTEEGAQIFQSFRDLAMEVPASVEELMKIGELGGQLGISSEALVGFTRTIADLGETTNLTQEEAAVAFAQIANIMGTAQDDFDNMGSAVVALGNNMATTERDIVNFAQRIAGAGQIAGLAEGEIFGIGAAFASVGVEAEAGGTAVQKVLLAMNEAVLTNNDQLKVFAETSGQSMEQFITGWQTGQAGELFTAFVQGLTTAGDDAMLILQDLGLEDQRLTRAFLSLAGAGDLLNESMNLGMEAWRENTALTEEAEKRYATTESQMKILKNTFRDMGITVGGALLPYLNQLLGLAQPFIKQLGEKLPGFLEEKVIPALNTFVGFLGENAPKAFQFLSDLWTNTLQPALSSMAAWLGENLPIAIQFLSNLWSNTLQPAIQAVSDFISGWLLPIINNLVGTFQDALPGATSWATETFAKLAAIWNDTLKPAFEELFSWLGEVLPPVIAALAEWYTGTLVPAFQAVYTWIVDNILPILAELVAWFVEHIPPAIEALATLWTETLKPALEKVWQFIQEKVVPILSEVWDWLQEKVPAAIETLRTWWEETLLPALEKVWSWISETLFPLFSELWAWLSTEIPAAIETLRAWWEDTLLPAITAVWEFLDLYIFPIFESIANLISTVLNVAIQTLSDYWTETLKPALEDVWDFISVSLQPVFTTLSNFFTETLGPAIVDIKDFIVDLWEKIRDDVSPGLETFKTEVVDALAAGFQAVKDALVAVKEWIDKLAEAIAAGDWKMVLSLFLPGSPPPLAEGFWEISDSIDDATRNLKKFEDAAGRTGDKLYPIFGGPVIPPVGGIGGGLWPITGGPAMPIGGGGGATARKNPFAQFLGEGMWDFASKFGSFGGAVLGRYNEKILSPAQDAVDAARDALEEAEKQSMLALESGDMWAYAMWEAKRVEAAKAYAEAGEEYADAQERALEYQKQMADLQFLKTQLDFLQYMRDAGANMTIFEGMKWGVDADLPAMLELMTQAMAALVTAAEDELGIGSPSRRFKELFENVMLGAAEGIRSAASIPQRMMAMTLGSMAGTITNAPLTVNRTAHLSMINNIYGGQDMSLMQYAVGRELRSAVGGLR